MQPCAPAMWQTKQSTGAFAARHLCLSPFASSVFQVALSCVFLTPEFAVLVSSALDNPPELSSAENQ
jgi:hypothetical protein